jgi:hypothetical protein
MWRELGQKVYEYFDSIAVKWTTIDPVCFTKVGKKTGPLHLWVGVMPRTLSCDNVEVAAIGCNDILVRSHITDVEVAFRESVFTRFAGPQFMDHFSSGDPKEDPTVNVRGPFTPALGLQIAPKATPYFEGTRGLYICEGGERNRVFLLMARHVVLPLSEYHNKLYTHINNSQPCHEVILLGSKAYGPPGRAPVYYA